jgi:glycosyltransferase involved in cell wall biosynthesis
MDQIHIVHLSTYPSDDIRIFQKACRSEVAQGYRVTQVVCGTGDETLEGVEILSVGPAGGRLSRLVALSWRMYRKAIRQGADLYQFHHPDLMLAGLLLKSSGKKVIYEPREFFPDKIRSMKWIPRWLRPLVSSLFRCYERALSAMWDHIIVADRYSAKAFSGRPVTVVPNYPLLTPVQPSAIKEQRPRRLIYVGGLSKDRGLLVMLTIAKLLRRHNVELVLMGKFASLEDERCLGALPNVRYLGTQDLQGVYAGLTQADLGLLLLQPVPAYTYAGENTLKLFEYMWCGLPVISSDFPALKEIIERAHCGICINPTEAEGAAAAILKLLNNQELRGDMGRNGRTAVIEAYNWPAANAAMNQAYKNVLNGVNSSVDPLPLWTKASISQTARTSAQGI